jgi:hypothetical protein
MAENVLKKEFKEKDVQRLRNLIQGKYGEKATMGTGYTKKQEFHEEGDVWEEDGRSWTIKDGIKQNITRLDKAKESLHLPLFCPECSKVMNHKFDKKFYIQYHRCYDCQLHFETNLRVKGLWDEYEKAQREIGKTEFNKDLTEGLILRMKLSREERFKKSLRGKKRS